MKERVLQSATKAATTSGGAGASPIALASPTPTGAPAAMGVLAHFVNRGNPFTAQSQSSQQQQRQQQPDAALLVFDAATITAPPPAAPAATMPLASPGGVSGSQPPPQQAQLPKPPVSWAITQAALNGLARFAGKYLQLMRLCPALALEAYAALLQLLDLYVYAVCAFFVPEPSLQLFLAGGARLNAEGSVVDELGWANEEVWVPLPCELEELAGLRAYLGRVRDDLIEEDHWEALAAEAAEAASKLKKLGADTAKKLGAFAAGQAALNNMMMMGGGGGGGGPGGAASSRGPSPSNSNLPPPIATGNRVRSGSGGPSPTHVAQQQRHEGESDGGEDKEEDEEGGEEDGGEGKMQRKAKKGSGSGGKYGKGRGPKRLVKRVKVQKPAFVAEALEDPEALYGLSQRAVAVESCAFLLELLRHLQPHALALLPQARKAAFPHGPCETYLDTVGEAVAQLRTLVLRAAAPKLVGAAAVVRAVEAQAWTAGGLIREEANAYTEELCGQCRALWAKVVPPAPLPGQDGGAGGGAMGGGGLDDTYIPEQCRVPIWTEACQAAMAALLEGFARVEQCAPEGRALMGMDIQAVQGGLDAIQRARPGRGRVHVDNYVKAYFLGEADLLAWAAQHHQAYFFRHVAGLLAASGAGQRLPKKKLRERIARVAAYYHPPQAPGGEEQHGQHHQQQQPEAGAARPSSMMLGGSGARSPTAGFSASSFMSGMSSAAARAAENAAKAAESFKI